MHTYATTKELKKEAFTVKIQNIKEAINIQVTLILENKHQIKIRPFFLANYSSISSSVPQYKKWKRRYLR